MAKFNESRQARRQRFKGKHTRRCRTGSKMLKRHGIPREDDLGRPFYIGGFRATSRRVEMRTYRLHHEQAQLQRRVARRVGRGR